MQVIMVEIYKKETHTDIVKLVKITANLLEIYTLNKKG